MEAYLPEKFGNLVKRYVEELKHENRISDAVELLLMVNQQMQYRTMRPMALLNVCMMPAGFYHDSRNLDRVSRLIETTTSTAYSEECERNRHLLKTMTDRFPIHQKGSLADLL